MKRTYPVLLSLLLLAQISLAQGVFYNNGATVSIKKDAISFDSAVVYIEGSLINRPNSTINNDGHIILHRDWINDGSYNSTGYAEFVGYLPSTILGTMYGAPDKDFHNLVINKYVNYPVRSLNDVDVDNTGSLGLLNGQFITDTNWIYINNPDPAAVYGHLPAGQADDNRYVNGNLYRAVDRDSAWYDFPVGIDSTSLGYQLSRVYFHRRFGTNYVRAYFKKTQTFPTFATECGNQYSCVLQNHGEWRMEVPFGKPVFDVALVPRKYTLACGSNTFYSMMRDGVMKGDTCTGHAGPLDSLAGTEIVRTNFDFKMGRFAVTGASLSNPSLCGTDKFEPNDSLSAAVQLPDVGIHLSAQICAYGDIDCFYFDTDHRNNFAVIFDHLGDNFELYLYDENFVKLDSSVNLGTAGEAIVMNNAQPYTRYYIKMFGRLGAFANLGYRLYKHQSNLPIQLVKNPASASRPEEDEFLIIEADRPISQLNIYPNPSDQQLFVSFYAKESSQAKIIITDMRGRLVKNIAHEIQEGNVKLDVQLGDLAEGLYFIKLQAGELVHTQKLEILR